MKYPYESAVIKEEVPVFALMTSVKYVAMHWHDRIELLLVLKGKIHVYVGREEYVLEENDLLLINSNEVHGVESDQENKLLLIQIPIRFIKRFYSNIENESFQCQSFQSIDQQSYNKIRSLIAELMLAVKRKEDNYEIKVHSLLLDVVYQLVTHFKVEKKNIIINTEKDIERMNRLTNYIQQHYMNPITLQELADTEELTAPYLSRYFQHHMGQSFIKYINGIRLEHAVRFLLETDQPIIQIALECGFPNLNSFHKLFKDTFHTTPHQYRKKQIQNNTSIRPVELSEIRGYEFTEEEDYQELYKLIG
ncbi:AraC family transcriptional regulator [Bacillus coreaensis]